MADNSSHASDNILNAQCIIAFVQDWASARQAAAPAGSFINDAKSADVFEGINLSLDHAHALLSDAWGNLPCASQEVDHD